MNCFIRDREARYVGASPMILQCMSLLLALLGRADRPPARQLSKEHRPRRHIAVESQSDPLAAEGSRRSVAPFKASRRGRQDRSGKPNRQTSLRRLVARQL